MLFTLLRVFALLGHFVIIHLQAQSFVPNSSSSLGVLPTTLFSTMAAPNLPLQGAGEAAGLDCGWTFAAAGSTAPGYFTIPVFATFNLGTGNVGSSNVGYGNVGYGNYGQGNIGRLNTGTGNVGYLNGGTSNAGAFNTGTGNIGDGNSQIQGAQFPAYGYNNGQAEAVIGANNAGSYLIGSQQQGTYLIGSQQQGTELIGFNNTGALATGVSNYESNADTIGVLNANGTEVIGQGNNGSYLVGFFNQGDGVVGYEGTGSLLFGFNVTGFNNTGVDLSGSGLIGSASNYSIVIGYNCSGQNIVGVNNNVDDSVASYGTFDNLVLPDYNVNFALPSGSLSTVASNYNTLPTTEQASSTGAFITQITAEYKFNVDVPAILSVVDLGCAGDLINVYDFGVLLFTTTAPSSTTLSCSQMSLSDPDAALAEYSYSRGFAYLTPGLHSLTFSVAAGGNGTALAFRIDSLGQAPCSNNQCPGPVPFLNPASRTPLVPNPPPWSLPKIIKEAEVIIGGATGSGAGNAGTGTTAAPSTNPSPNAQTNTTATTTPLSTTPNNTQLIQPCNCNNNTVSLSDSSTSSTLQTSTAEAVNLSHKSKSKFRVKRVGRFLLVSGGEEVEWSRAGLVCAKLGSSLAVPDKEGDRLALMNLPSAAWVGADWRGNRMGGACLQLNEEGKILIASSCKLKLSVLCART